MLFSPSWLLIGQTKTKNVHTAFVHASAHCWNWTNKLCRLHQNQFHTAFAGRPNDHWKTKSANSEFSEEKKHNYQRIRRKILSNWLVESEIRTYGTHYAYIYALIYGWHEKSRIFFCSTSSEHRRSFIYHNETSTVCRSVARTVSYSLSTVLSLWISKINKIDNCK